MIFPLAQRFNAGFQMARIPKSLQGRKNRVCSEVLLSSLKGLEYFIADVPSVKTLG
jgi:hypothetical protein